MPYLNAVFCMLFVLATLALPTFTVSAHSDFSEVIRKVKSQVVGIEVRNKKAKISIKERKEVNKVLGEYSDFYRVGRQPLSSKALGTGFLVKVAAKDGNAYVLTAEHVVRRAEKIYVNSSEYNRVRAKVVWSDRKKDVALLAIPKEANMIGLSLSEVRMKEGQEVLAISGAFGLSLSSSTGIVSALDVKLKKGQSYGLMQTDAAVNPGSSGGPLFNVGGEVVGLISNIYSNSGDFSGAAFVIPADVLIKLLEKKGFSI